MIGPDGREFGELVQGREDIAKENAGKSTAPTGAESDEAGRCNG